MYMGSCPIATPTQIGTGAARWCLFWGQIFSVKVTAGLGASPSCGSNGGSSGVMELVPLALLAHIGWPLFLALMQESIELSWMSVMLTSKYWDETSTF